MPNTVYDSDADQEQDLSHIRSAEKNADGPGAADEQSGIKSYDNAGPGQKLAQQETDAADDTVGNGYTPSGKGTGKRGIKFRGGFWTKKRAGIAGGILGLGVGGGLFIGTISVGPLELLTASHALQNSFSRSDNDSSSRLSMLFKYARFAKTGDVGETRVSIVGSKIFGNAKQALSDAGVDFDRNAANGRNTRLNIDQEKLSKSVPELEGKELGSPDAKAVLAEKLGVPIDDIASTGNGKFSVDLKGYSIKSLRVLNKSTLKLLGDGKIVTAVRARALNKFFDLPSLLHPFSKSRAAAENKLAESIVKQKESKGEPPAQAQDEAAQEAAVQENADAAAKSTTEPFNSEAKADLSAIEEENSGVGSALTKGLTITGAACIVRNTAGEIAKANRDLVELPAAAAAMRVIAAGEQVEAGGSDVTAQQVGAMAKSFSNGDGQTILDGMAFQSLRDPTGNPTGKDLPGKYRSVFSGKSTAQTIKDGADSIINDSLGFITWIPGINAGTLCSDAGLITQAAAAIVVSVGSEVLSGGLDTPAVAAMWTGKFIASNAISMIALGAILDLVKNVAVNNQLPQKIFEGPVGGDLLAYGSRFAANTASVAAGGVALVGSSSTTLPNTAGGGYAYDTTSSESLYERTLSLKNPNSLAANLAMDYYSSSLSSGITGIASSFLNIGSFISHSFASLLPHTSAATDAAYDWGFPQYGIPDDMLNDPSLADPYANADTVAKVLDSGDGQNYIDKAHTCFGVNIQKGSDGKWDVTPGDSVDTSSTDYTSAGCTEDSGSGNVDGGAWRRVIMFVFDTRTMNAAACYDGDNDGCTSEGINNGASSTDTGTAPSGDTASLAQQLLSNSNVTLSASSKADLEAASQGQKVTPGPIGDGSSGLPGCTARTPTDLNPELLKTALNIAQKYKYQINDIVSGHDCDTGKHPVGRAMDIFYIDGKPLNDSWWSSDSNVATINDIGNIVHNTDKYQFGFGVGCTAVTKIQSRGNLEVFNDSCGPQDEIHIDVRGAP